MSDILYNTKFLQLKSTKSKSGHIWFYAHRPNVDNVVVILPVTEDEVLFLIEERPPLYAEGKGRFSIGLPAGLVGDIRKDETIENAIKTELLEEAGLNAENINIKVNKSAGSSGCISETCVIAIAKIGNKTIVSQPTDDGGIIVDRVWIKKDKILSWLNEKDSQGYVISAHTLGALFYLFAEEKI